MLSLTLGLASVATVLSVLGMKQQRFKRDRLARLLREQEERAEQARIWREQAEQQRTERQRQERSLRERREQGRRELLNKFPLVRYIPAPEESSHTRGKDQDSQMGESCGDIWIQSDLPDLHLESHRAVCPICLMDFEEPRKKEMVQSVENEQYPDPGATNPIRLLSCGHAYHKSCIDPWLLHSSRDCPYCKTMVIPSSTRVSSFTSISSYADSLF